MNQIKEANPSLLIERGLLLSPNQPRDEVKNVFVARNTLLVPIKNLEKRSKSLFAPNFWGISYDTIPTQVVGDGAVGKTSFIRGSCAMVSWKEAQDYIPTVQGMHCSLT